MVRACELMLGAVKTACYGQTYELHVHIDPSAVGSPGRQRQLHIPYITIAAIQEGLKHMCIPASTLDSKYVLPS